MNTERNRLALPPMDDIERDMLADLAMRDAQRRAEMVAIAQVDPVQYQLRMDQARCYEALIIGAADDLEADAKRRMVDTQGQPY